MKQGSVLQRNSIGTEAGFGRSRNLSPALRLSDPQQTLFPITPDLTTEQRLEQPQEGTLQALHSNEPSAAVGDAEKPKAAITDRTLECRPDTFPTFDLALKRTALELLDCRVELSKADRKQWALLNPFLFAEWYIKPFDKKWNSITPDFHYLMMEFVLQHENIVMHVPIEHAKSTLLSLVFPLWLTYQDRNIRGAIFSNTSRQAQSFASRLRWHFQYNELLKEDFGTFAQGGVEPSDKWTNEQFFVKRDPWAQSKDPTWQALGVEGAIYGARLDIAIFDDIIDTSNSQTEHVRNKVEQWYYEMAESRLVEGGKAVVLGTLQSRQDLLCKLAANPEYAYLRLSALSDNGKKTLWPGVWSIERLMKKKRTVGTARFQKMLQNDRTALSGKMLKLEWLNFYGHDRAVQLPPMKDLTIFFGVDPAIATSPQEAELKGADFFALAILALDTKEQKVFILEIKRIRATLAQQVQVIREAYKRYQPQRIAVEANAYQKALVQTLWAEDRILPLIPVQTTKSKTVRMEALATHFETKRIWIKPDEFAFIDEWCEFPTGRHDDTLDAVEFAFGALSRNYAGGAPSISRL